MKRAVAQQSLSNTLAESQLRIDGTPEVGQMLSADSTAIADADGLDNAVFQYQGLAGGILPARRRTTLELSKNGEAKSLSGALV